MSKLLNKLDNHIVGLLSNNTVKFLLVLVAIVFVLYIKRVPTTQLLLFKNVLFRIVIALLVAYLACCEPMYAIVVTSIFILSLQELHNRHIEVETKNMLIERDALKQNNSSLNKNKGNKVFLEDAILDVNSEDLSNDAKVRNLQEEYNMNKNMKDRNNKAYNTMSQNLEDDYNSYIIKKNLNDAQNNLITGSDPEKPVEVFEKILNAQGLLVPSGFNTSPNDMSPIKRASSF